MHVKGVAYLAREAAMVEHLGAADWKGFVDGWRAKNPAFPNTVLPVSKIEAGVFLAFHDEMVRRFFDGDDRAYWTFGEKSGQYALTQGQLKGLFKPGEARRFLNFTPNVYKSYFDGGRIEVSAAPEHVDIHISDAPPHVYFEYSVLGFAKGALEVLQAAQPTPERIRGISAGDSDVLYRFYA